MIKKHVCNLFCFVVVKRMCSSAWIQIPTMVVPAGVDVLGAATSSDTEAFCGGYLNQITGQTLPGTVIGMLAIT
jgi:hypothetical protein